MTPEQKLVNQALTHASFLAQSPHHSSAVNNSAKLLEEAAKEVMAKQSVSNKEQA